MIMKEKITNEEKRGKIKEKGYNNFNCYYFHNMSIIL